MNVEVSQPGLNIKEEYNENEISLDDSCKLNGFLYVDTNDYNENNFDSIDIKEEEEQVEDLTFEKNTKDISDIYLEESLPLNSVKNLTKAIENDLEVTGTQAYDKNYDREIKIATEQLQSESIPVKTQLCSNQEGVSESKKYTLRARTWSQKINLDLLENISNKSKNVKPNNKTDAAACRKFGRKVTEDDLSGVENFKCFYCGVGFIYSSSFKAHIKICKYRSLKKGVSSKLNCKNDIIPNNEIILGSCLKGHKEINCKCKKCKRNVKKKSGLASHIIKAECNCEEYLCAFCEQTFLRKDTLKKHIIAHLRNKKQCQWCFQRFTGSKNMRSHFCGKKITRTNFRKSNKSFLAIRSYEFQTNKGDSKCQQCNKSKVTCKKFADNHLPNVSLSKIFNCHICKRNYVDIASYRKHLKNHKEVSKSVANNGTATAGCVSSSAKDSSRSGASQKKNTYKCDTCGKLFIKLVKLKIHILNVHQGINYQCEKCNVKFLSQEDLDSHKTKDKCKPEDLYSCKTCGKVFAKKDYLKKHQYMHMSVLFKCRYCYCAFMKEKSYNKHMEKMNCSKSARKIRMAEFNYKKCRLCEIEFETEELLIAHFRVSHVGLEPHQCFCCDLCLPTFLELQDHIHQHNIQKYTCNLCGKPYTSQEGFRKHRLKHKGAEFKCKYCESEFLNERRFKFHEKTCKKNPNNDCEPSQKNEKPKKKDTKPKQSRQLHWESRIIMTRLRGDPTLLSVDQKYPMCGSQDSSMTSTFFDEPESETTNERGWFDNYYKTEEDDIAFGLKKANELTSQDCSSEPVGPDACQRGFAKKGKISSSSPGVNSDAAEGNETEPGAHDLESASENSSTESEEEVQSMDLPIDYNPKKCRLCVISFGQEYELLHHFIKSHPGEHAHECPHCGIKSPLYAQLKEHMKTHGIGIGIFNCDNCSKQFKSEKKMSSHNIRCKGINNDKSLPKEILALQSGDDGCRRCGKKFHSKVGYRRHKILCKKKKKKNENSEKTPFGSTKLSIKDEAVGGGLTESNDFQSSSPEENVKTAESAISQNTISVFKERTNCTKLTEGSSVTVQEPKEEKKKVEKIKNTYSGEPPMDSFPCRLCDKKFQYERGIVMHFKTAHPGNKPLICHVCNMHLADKLKEHLKTHGIGEEFICELCGKRFNQKFLSKIHEIWHQGIEYKCSNCKQKFLNKEKMDKHIKENRCSNRQSLMRLPCDICGKSYRSKFGLNKHYITHTPKELRPVKNRMNCEFCGKWFDNNNGLQRHRRIHTGERPFCCRFCPKAFAQEGNCKAHERIHTGESKPRKKKVSSLAMPPGQVLPPDPLVPHLPAMPSHLPPAPAVESIPYPGQINLYNYNNVDPRGTVH